MVVNEYPFIVNRTVVPGSVENIVLDRAPFGVTGPQYAGLFCEMNLCLSGDTSSKITMQKWMFGWRFNSAGHISTSSADLKEIVFPSTWGGNVPSSVIASVISFNPAIIITLHAYSGIYLVCSGKVWLSTAS